MLVSLSSLLLELFGHYQSVQEPKQSKDKRVQLNQAEELEGNTWTAAWNQRINATVFLTCITAKLRRYSTLLLPRDVNAPKLILTQRTLAASGHSTTRSSI